MNGLLKFSCIDKVCLPYEKGSCNTRFEFQLMYLRIGLEGVGLLPITLYEISCWNLLDEDSISV